MPLDGERCLTPIRDKLSVSDGRMVLSSCGVEPFGADGLYVPGRLSRMDREVTGVWSGWHETGAILP
jgi:hypothetical protein